MRRPFLPLLFLLPTLLGAQTYYYVNNIGVSPAAPTTADPVTITLLGDLSATNSFIIGTSSNVVGGQVELMVNAGSQGIGAPVLVPHDEPFALGTLAAGTYTIVITGSSMADLAPAAAHQFTVSAGGPGQPCDSLSIGPITWHPFTDTALVLNASNSSSVLFDYPGFVLLDSGGDTLAQESMNYFGIGQGPQPHVLGLHPGAMPPAGPFSGRLDLWTLFYTEAGCSWTEVFDLCPPPPCSPLRLTFGNFGGALVTASFAWSVTDGLGNTLASGTFDLDALTQFDTVTVCLPPGLHTYQVVQPNVTGGQLVFGMEATGIAGPQQTFIQGGASNQLPFSFLPACINGTNGVASPRAGQGLQAWCDGSILHVRSPGSVLEQFRVLDAQGRVVAATRAGADAIDLDLSRPATGILLLERTAPDGSRSAIRIPVLH